MALVSLVKLKREAVPLIFFGTVVSVKVYYLGKTLFVDGGWWKLLNLISDAHSGGDEVNYVILNMVTYIFYNVVAILFDALVFASYLMRLEPRRRAKGFWETVYPLATILLPVLGITLLAIPGVRELVPTYDFRELAIEYDLSPTFLVLAHVAALMIGVIGATLSIIALWSLKRSFSLMAEVRELVRTGLYRKIRHPLYMAEIIHGLSIATLSASPVGLWLFVIVLAMQVVRAKIEEHKFLQTIPEYSEFKNNTGFLWPKLW